MTLYLYFPSWEHSEKGYGASKDLRKPKIGETFHMSLCI